MNVLRTKPKRPKRFHDLDDPYYADEVAIWEEEQEKYLKCDHEWCYSVDNDPWCCVKCEMEYYEYYTKKYNNPTVSKVQCKHLRTGDYEGAIICFDCGEEARDERVFQLAMPTLDNNYAFYEDIKLKGDPNITPVNPAATPVNPAATPVNPAATPVNPAATPVELRDSEEATRSASEASSSAAEQREARAEPIPIIEPTSLKDLKKIAKNRGVKYFSRMNKKQLCEVLNIEMTEEIGYTFTNKETGNKQGFTSIYKAAKVLGVNAGLIYYYIGKEMLIDDTMYSVTKH